MGRIPFAIVVALALCVGAFADEIVLKSGVVLEGQATPVGDQYRVDLASGGQMTVPKSLVVDVRRGGRSVAPAAPVAPAPAPVRTPTRSAQPSFPAPMPASAPAPVPTPRTWSQPAPPPAPYAVGPVYERRSVPPMVTAPCAPPCPPVPCDPCAPEDPCEPCRGSLAPWAISLGLAYTQAGGDSESISFKFDFEVTYEKDPWKWVTGGFYAYGESSGVVDPNRFFVESKLERKLTQRVYTFLKGSYDTDEVSSLDYRVIGTVGAGALIIDRTNVELRGELGAGVTAEKRAGFPETLDPSAYLGLDYAQEWDWGGALALDYDFVPNLDNWDLSVMTLDAKFEVPLSACLNLRLGFRIDYQFEPQDPTVEKVRWIFSTGISVNF